MIDAITFTIGSREVEARPGETIWQVVKSAGPDQTRSVRISPWR
jgi:hypothetical protein